ncbi:hypothetical protein P7C73_g516, partial [Tremellales sp. Uapishka_1]
MNHHASPPLPNLHTLSISPYPSQPNDYRYNGVFAPPPSQPTQGWASPNKRGSRSGIPNGWLDSAPSRESPNPQFDYYRRDGSSPPALSPPSSTTSGPTTSSSHPYYNQPSGYPGLDSNSFSSMGSAPNLAGYAPTGMPQFGSQSLASINRPLSGNGWRNGYPGMAPLDDDIIPTAIVIKNIPFAVNRETLLAVIESLGAPLPYAFNYHHDNGVFRGLAFANFRQPEEAAGVVAALNGYDVQGRKLRVEYKKVLQAGEKERIERDKAIKRMKSIQFDKEAMPPPLLPSHAQNGLGSAYQNGRGSESEYSPPHSASSGTSENLPLSLDLNDPVALDIYSRVLVFKEDRMRDELAFSKTLTPTERRIVHLVAHKLGLASITKGEGDYRVVVVTREAPPRPTLTSSASASLSSTYLSPYSSTQSEISPSLRIKKSMPDLRGFNGPVVSRDPARSLTPQRSSGNLRSDSREYVSMGPSAGRRVNGLGSGTFNSLFGAPVGGVPPVPPLPSGLGQDSPSSSGDLGSSSAPLRNPRGPAGESRGFGGGLRPSASGGLGRIGAALGRRVSEEDEDEYPVQEATRTRESLEL